MSRSDWHGALSLDVIVADEGTLLQQESYSKVLPLMSECNYAKRQNEFEAISSQLPAFCN